MQYIRGMESYQESRNSAITLGKFDGLHQGHELLISRIVEHQKTDDVVGIVFAFDMKQKGQQNLLTNEEKAEKLDGRIHYFIDCPFTKEISEIEAEAFISEILVGKFHAKYIVVGKDFRFGYKAQGNYQLLEQHAAEYGYQVEVIEKMCYEGREISSTYIREEFSKGNYALVDKLLGYSYCDTHKNVEKE